MTLSAIRISTMDTITISKISEIHEENGIYYISGDYNPRCMSSVPVTLVLNGDIILKAYKIELDIRQYQNIKLT